MRLLIVFMLLITLSNTSVGAQDYEPPLDLTYNAVGGDFSFTYPLGWSASPINSAPGVVLLTNTPAARERLEGIAEGSLPFPGEVAVLFFDSEYNSRRFGASSARGALSVAATMARTFAANPFFPDFIDISALTIDGRDAAQGIAYRGNVGGMIGMVNNGEGAFIGMIALTPLIEFTLWQPLLTRILFSVGASGSEDAPLVSDTIDGLTLNWVATNAARNMVGRAAAAGGRIFIADGASGIVVLSEAGDVLGRLANPDIVIASAITRAPDGTLWVADPGAKRLWNISAVGATIQSVGDADTFAASGSPEAVEVMPDGTILSSEQRFNMGALEQWISVWRANNGVIARERDFRVPLPGSTSSVLAADDAGIYTADSVNGIALISLEGAVLSSGIVAAELENASVRGMALLPDGSLVLGIDASDDSDAAIWRVTPTGEVIARSTADQFGLNPFRHLADFALSEDQSRLYVVDLDPSGSRVIAFQLALLSE